MVEFPSRVRYLYLKRSQVSHEIQNAGITRPLEIAISQFAPSSETVKDKTLYTSVGFVDYRRRFNKDEEQDGRGEEFKLGVCGIGGARSDPSQTDGFQPMITHDKPRFELFLLVALENAAGYCRHLADEAVIRDELLARLVDPDNPFRQVLDQHAHARDSSCLDYIRHYDNAEFHGLLDWRLGLAFALLFNDPHAEVGFHHRLGFGPPE